VRPSRSQLGPRQQDTCTSVAPSYMFRFYSFVELVTSEPQIKVEPGFVSESLWGEPEHVLYEAAASMKKRKATDAEDAPVKKPSKSCLKKKDEDGEVARNRITQER
jgi:hypothetical protein